MRTTLTLEPDVAEKIRQETVSGKVSLKQVINDRLRQAFGITPERTGKPFHVEPHRSAYQPGVDPLKLNQLLDELEAQRFVVRETSSPGS